MTSPSPLCYDTYYHLYNRGVNRENIFIEERNYEYFLNLYWKYIEPVADIFAYCLLRNHFHLAIRVKSEEEIRKTLKVSSATNQQLGQDASTEQNVSQPEKPLGPKYVSNQFSNFFNAYAKAINKAYQRTGSLFQHPFGRVAITTDHQFWNVIRYIHQNPQKHGFTEDFRHWNYSSYGIVLAEGSTRLKREELLDWFGGKVEYYGMHAEWVNDTHGKWFVEDNFD